MVAVGDEVLDECIARFHVAPQRVVMIPYGRDPSQYRPRSGPSVSPEATLIFVGAFTVQKQPDRFIEVVRRLRAEGRPFNALMVGDGPLAATLAPQAAAQGIELLGERPDVPELLRRSDVFVFPSRPGWRRHAWCADRGRDERPADRGHAHTGGGERHLRRPNRDDRRRLGDRDSHRGRRAPRRPRPQGRDGGGGAQAMRIDVHPRPHGPAVGADALQPLVAR